MFATASLDKTIKVWSLGSATCNFTLEGHEKGINCLDYYAGTDRPWLFSGGDDCQVRVWDYQSRTCLRTLTGHAQNVSALAMHPTLPLLLTAGEDGALRCWSSSSGAFRQEACLRLPLERIWTVAVKGMEVALGGDAGSMVLQLGRAQPIYSLSATGGGKLLWTRQQKGQAIMVTNLLGEEGDEMLGGEEGQALSLPSRELGTSEVFPSLLCHSPTGRFVAVAGEGEYIVYTAVAWRNKAFGKALDFCWAHDSNDYAVRESSSSVLIVRNFATETPLAIKPVGQAEALYGGQLVGVYCAGAQLELYDWQQARLVRRIDVEVSQLAWSPSGTRLAIASPDGTIYLLRYHPEVMMQQPMGEDGWEGALVLESEVEVKQGLCSMQWLSTAEGLEALVWSTRKGQVYHVLAGETDGKDESLGVAPFCLVRAVDEEALFVAGYLQEKLVVMDMQQRIYAYSLPSHLLSYQQAIVNGDEAKAQALLPKLSPALRSRLAPLLEQLGRLEAALEVACDPDYRLPLALKLGKLPLALHLASQLDTIGAWQQLGDAAWHRGDLVIAKQAYEQAQDWPSLLLLHGGGQGREGKKDLEGLFLVGRQSKQGGQLNVALTAFMAAGKLVEAVEVLMAGERYPEAAALARRAAPHLLPTIIGEWNAMLARQKHPLANLMEVGQVDTKPRHSFFQPPLPPQFDNDQLSMEVNTTGTGSVRAEDVDELIAMKNENRLEPHAEEDSPLSSLKKDEQEPEYDASLLVHATNTLDAENDDWA